MLILFYKILIFDNFRELFFGNLIKFISFLHILVYIQNTNTSILIRNRRRSSIIQKHLWFLFEKPDKINSVLPCSSPRQYLFNLSLLPQKHSFLRPAPSSYYKRILIFFLQFYSFMNRNCRFMENLDFILFLLWIL